VIRRNDDAQLGSNPYIPSTLHSYNRTLLNLRYSLIVCWSNRRFEKQLKWTIASEQKPVSQWIKRRCPERHSRCI